MKLMFGCLGNGTTGFDVSNRHETVCHISIHGHIRYYMEIQDIPLDCLESIQSMAEQSKREFMKEWDKKTTIEKYCYMMDVPTIGCGYNAFTQVAHDCRNLPLDELVTQMEAVFFETHM